MPQTGFLVLLLLFASPMCIVVTPTHAKLVPLHRHDSFFDCLTQFDQDGVYCVAQAYIKPANQTQAWIDIVEHSKAVENHFRHDRISRAICIRSCESRLQLVDAVEDIPLTPKFDIDPWLYRPAPDVDRNIVKHRAEFEETIQQCVNLELRDYGLEAYTEIDFCLEPDEVTADGKWDPQDLVVGFTLLLIVGCCLFSSLYDINIDENNSPDHFKKIPQQARKAYLAFSIPRNWTTFIDSGHSKPGDYFDYFEGLRLLSMILITIFHTFSYIATVNIVNPKDYEAGTLTTAYKIVSGGSFTVQIFFTFTGFLLTLPNVAQVNQGKPLTFHDFLISFKNRLIRIYPVYMFVILLEATLMRKIGSGWIWMQLAGFERGYCRNSWWKNLLFINNLVGTEQMCLVQSELK